MEMPAARLQHRKGVAYYTILLLAGSSLCLGLGSGLLLLRIRNDASNSPQPYVATASDLDAEKQAQRRNVAELLGKTSLPNSPSPIATTTPEEQKSLDKKSEPRKSTQPEDTPPPPKKPQKHNTAPPAALTDPNLPPSRIIPEINRGPFDLRDLTNRITEASNVNKLLFNYLADEIAAIHVEMRNVGSRMAVTEYAIKQVQELSFVFWLNVLGTVVGALQGLVALYEFSRERWRTHRPGTAP